MLKKLKFLLVLAAVFAVAGCKAEVTEEEEVAAETPKYTITYDENGHGTAPEAKTVEKGYKLTAEDLPALTADGFDFGGWKFNEKIVAVGEEVVSDMTLIAAWTEWGTVAAPTFSVAAGEVDKGTKVKITCTTEGAEIYYTTDGSAPTAGSTKYESEIEITAATTIKAFAGKSGMKDSGVASAEYTVYFNPVTNLTAKYMASGTVKLTWTNPADTDFAKAVITYDTNKTKEVKVTDNPNNEATIEGLTDGIEYTFTVKACDTSENVSSGTNVKATPHIPSPAELTKAGTKPEDKQGTQDLPIFFDNTIAHFYLAESAANTNVKLQMYQTSYADTYQWYTGTTDVWQAISSNGTSTTLPITVATGTTYYILEARSEDGQSIAYSNVYTVVCGGDKTANIGKIAYSDGTYSENYESSKTPIGIIFDVNEDGSPKKIVNLAEKHDIAWSDEYTHVYEYSDSLNLSYTDGSNNFNDLCDYEGDNCDFNSGCFPAFKYCYDLKDSGKTWYLPAIDELLLLCFNKGALNSAIQALKNEGVEATLLSDSYYWSSTNKHTPAQGEAWDVDFGRVEKRTQLMIAREYVRGVASF